MMVLTLENTDFTSGSSLINFRLSDAEEIVSTEFPRRSVRPDSFILAESPADYSCEPARIEFTKPSEELLDVGSNTISSAEVLVSRPDLPAYNLEFKWTPVMERQFDALSVKVVCETATAEETVLFNQLEARRFSTYLAFSGEDFIRMEKQNRMLDAALNMALQYVDAVKGS